MDLSDPTRIWRSAVSEALAAPGAGSADFDLNTHLPRPRRDDLRPAAVLVGLIDGAGGPEVLLTKRSSKLRHHPGQIAFPGGKQDDGDADAETCALREAHEEVGLPMGHVEVIGRLPGHETVTGFAMTPVVGWITQPFTARPEAGEVTEAFQVPLAHVADTGRFRIEGRRWRGARRLYYTVPWGPYYIWGATARILRGLAERLAQ